MKFFIDTEFIESGSSRPIELLSIGIVGEDGREFYVVNGDADFTHANDWVKANVVPHLGSPGVAFSKIGSGIIHWIRDSQPEFWGYYADYDWVVFCQIFGSMIDLPKGWPMYCRDLKQFCDSLGNPQLPPQVSTEHNALNDAKWNKIAYEFLARYFPGGEKSDRCPSCGSDLRSYRGSAYDLPNRRLVECGNKFHGAASPQPSGEEQR